MPPAERKTTVDVLGKVPVSTRDSYKLIKNQTVNMTQAEVVGLALQFAINEDNIEDFREFIDSKVEFEKQQKTEEEVGDEDLLAGARATSSDDLPDDVEDTEFHMEQQSELTEEELLESIDSLGEPE